ncbi:unnamed protein product [Polarella glacialis]|uniref:Xaa-Pro dipeptidyl-peptidase C-terminal domain-containing protein n=1 Tax=Polarella glacialis TaxID=89957 RepID=A0A813JX19_POLGL|nr:unnamed protein product [Polarella glacialis]
MFSSHSGGRAGKLVVLVSMAVLAMRHFGPRLLLRLMSAFFGLVPPRPGKIRRLGNLRVPGGSDGVVLSTVVFSRETKAPTLLIRTPYCMSAIELVAYVIAAQGFNVVLQDCRGRFESSGAQSFAAFEDLDGVATLEWLAEPQQGFSWFDPERVVMFGISYLGIVQWALVAGLDRQRHADASSMEMTPHVAQGQLESAGTEAAVTRVSALDSDNGPKSRTRVKIAAIAPLFCASRAHDVFFQGGAFALDFYLRYVHFMLYMRKKSDLKWFVYNVLLFEVRLRRHATQALGTDALHQNLALPKLFKFNPRPSSQFWKLRDYSDALACAPPSFIATGWFDIFLEGSLRDYEALSRMHAPGHAQLLVGPWYHLESVGPTAFRILLRSSIDFLQQHTGLALPDSDESKPSVRLWIMGARAAEGQWRSFRAWPPEEATEELLLLAAGSLGGGSQHVDEQPSALSRRSRLVYDPLQPTPSLGGCLFSPRLAGEKEQSSLERRKDVLIFDSKQLAADMVVVGRARLRLFIKASQPNFDIFARLCDVHPSGLSYNVCDAVLRRRGPSDRSQSHQEIGARRTWLGGVPGEVADAGDAVVAELVFSATAKCFRAGHKVRLLVASGAFPRFARHFGDVEQTIEAEPLEVQGCEIEVLHDEPRPSALWLPVLYAPGSESPARRRRSLAEAAAKWPASPLQRSSGLARKILSVASLREAFRVLA